MRVDYFSRRQRGRGALDLYVDSRTFSLSSSIAEDPIDDRTKVTLLGGKRIAGMTLSAGMIDSQLGAAMRLQLIKKRIDLDIYASRFYGDRNLLLKALLTFSLGRNFYLQAGYADLLNHDMRELLMGFGVSSKSRQP